MKSKEFIIAKSKTLREAPEDFQRKYSQGWKQIQTTSPQQSPQQPRIEPKVPQTTQPPQNQGSRNFNKFRPRVSPKVLQHFENPIQGERRLMNTATVSRFAKFFKNPVVRGVGGGVVGVVGTTLIMELLSYLYDVIMKYYSNDPNVVNAAKESAKELEAAKTEQEQNQTLTPETEQKIKEIFNDLRETFNITTQQPQPAKK